MEKKSLIGPEIQEILALDHPYDRLRDAFKDMHPYDIFVLCEDLENDEVAECIKALGIPSGILLFEEFDDERKEEIFDCFSKDWMAEILEEMSPDERADFVKNFSEEKMEAILPLVARAERLDIKKLIEYHEDTAGSILTTEYASLPENVTVKAAIEKIKLQAFDSETIYYIYITNNERELLGFISLRDLLIAPSSVTISSIMNKNVISAKVDDDKELVAKMLSDYDFLAIPVVDASNKLIGIVTVDDVVDVVIEENTEDMYKLAAAGEYQDYKKTAPFSIAKQRFFWLLVLIFVGFISAWVLEYNSDQLKSVVALTFFIPLLLGAGGNAGTQSSTVVIRGMATGNIEIKDVLSVFLKELQIGLIVGALMAMLVSVRALMIEHDPKLGITVGIAMVATVVLATTLGALLPILFKRLKLDPALMSGPFITSIVDIVSLVIYFKIAMLVF